VMVIRELQRNPQLGLVPVGFVDDDPEKRGKQILGVTVLGDLASLVSVARAHAAGEVLVAMPTASGAALRKIALDCREAHLPSRTIPGVFELLDGQVSVNRMRQIEISDLLRRAPVGPDSGSAAFVAGRNVLVTGAGGSIGSELCRQVAAQRPSRLILLGHGENSLYVAQGHLAAAFPGLSIHVVVADIRDRARIQKVFAEFRPMAVFHAAAHKHVPLMEDNPEEAVSNNIVGTRNVVEAALEAGVRRLVMISTDKAVSPSCIMGASKRMAETIVRAAARRHGAPFMVVRFGNVLGSRGSVVPAFKRQIELGGPITITHPDMRRFFMTIPEAVHLVLQAAGIGRGGELFVLEMGEPVRIVDLAKDLITLSGLDPAEIPITFTGIRPGEKLEEELWERGAMVKPTEVPNILSVEEPELLPDDELETAIGRITDAASLGQRILIEAELARSIKSYVPSSTPAKIASPEAAKLS
jgi:FlaA1/EpsC-like NDP-sugar epimerase